MAKAVTYTPPTPHSITEILEIKKSQKDPIWGPITRKSITLLYGSTGVGKSLFTLGLAFAIAAKEKFCGYLPAMADFRIVALDGEMDLEDWAHRARMLCNEMDMNIPCDSINVFTREDFGTGLVPNISLPESQNMYSKLFEPFDIVIIDNLNTTSYPRKDNDGEISQFLRVLPWLLKMRDAGKAVVLIHHTNKAGQQMGSILKEQIATNVIELEKVQSQSDNLRFKILFHKHRHVSRAEAKPLMVEAVPSPSGMSWLTEDPSVSTESRIIEMSKDGIKQREIAEQMGLDLYEVSQILKKSKSAFSSSPFDGGKSYDQF